MSIITGVFGTFSQPDDDGDNDGGDDGNKNEDIGGGGGKSTDGSTGTGTGTGAGTGIDIGSGVGKGGNGRLGGNSAPGVIYKGYSHYCNRSGPFLGSVVIPIPFDFLNFIHNWNFHSGEGQSEERNRQTVAGYIELLLSTKYLREGVLYDWYHAKPLRFVKYYEFVPEVPAVDGSGTIDDAIRIADEYFSHFFPVPSKYADSDASSMFDVGVLKHFRIVFPTAFDSDEFSTLPFGNSYDSQSRWGDVIQLLFVYKGQTVIDARMVVDDVYLEAGGLRSTSLGAKVHFDIVIPRMSLCTSDNNSFDDFRRVKIRIMPDGSIPKGEYGRSILRPLVEVLSDAFNFLDTRQLIK